MASVILIRSKIIYIDRAISQIPNTKYIMFNLVHLLHHTKIITYYNKELPNQRFYIDLYYQNINN